MTAVLASLSISREAANKAVDFIGLLLSHKLPAELVDSTEALLVRLQAVHRIANLLCPPSPFKEEAVHAKGMEVAASSFSLPCCAVLCHAMLCCVMPCCAVLSCGHAVSCCAVQC